VDKIQFFVNQFLGEPRFPHTPFLLMGEPRFPYIPLLLMGEPRFPHTPFLLMGEPHYFNYIGLFGVSPQGGYGGGGTPPP